MTSLSLFDTSPTGRSHSRSSSSSSSLSHSAAARRSSSSATSAFFASSWTPPSSRPGSPPPPRRPLFTRRASSGTHSPSLAAFPATQSPGLSSWPTSSPSPAPDASPNGFLFMGPHCESLARRRRSSLGSDKGKERASLDWDCEDAILEEDEDKAPSQKASREDLKTQAIEAATTASKSDVWDSEQEKPWRPLSSRPAFPITRPKSYPNHEDSLSSMEGRLDRLVEVFQAVPPTFPPLEHHSVAKEDALNGVEGNEVPEGECVPAAKYTPLHRVSLSDSCRHPSALRLTSSPRPSDLRRGSFTSTKSCHCKPCLGSFPSLAPNQRRRTSQASTESSSSVWDDDGSESGGGGDGTLTRDQVGGETATAQTSPAWSLEGKSWDTFEGKESGELKIPLTVGEEDEDEGSDEDEVFEKVRVRFCEGDVEEIITWSPQIYNRKGPAPIGKLSMRDILELQEIKQELGIASQSGNWGIGIGIGLANSSSNNSHGVSVSVGVGVDVDGVVVQ